MSCNNLSCIRKKLTAYFYGPTIFASDNSGSLDITGVTTEDDIIKRIINGSTRGLSPEYKIKWYQCMICQKNYEDCPHEDGKEYGGVKCILAPRDLEFITQSIVDKPEDSRLGLLTCF